MRYRSLGATGLQVSELSLGAMTFGHGQPVATVDQAGADRLVGMARDAGVNLFDTADVYSNGQSEEILGRALAPHRDEVLVATKVGFGRGGLSPRQVIEGCEASLRRLATDRIDLLQIHKPDPHTPFEETARALDELVRRGLVRHIGLCNMWSWTTALAVSHQREHGLATFCSAQMYYSLVGRGIEAEFLPCAAYLGLGVLVYSPLAGGYLSGRYRAGTRAGGRRDTMRWPPVDPAIGAATMAALDRVAAARATSAAAVSLAWLLAHASVSSVIVGASSAGQLESNLAAVDVALTETERVALDQASDAARHVPYWWPEMFERGDHRTRLLEQPEGM